MVRLFEGVEAEGKLRGHWTLFVSGDVPFLTIQDTIEKSFEGRRYTQIYFGADGGSYINWDSVRKCLRMYPDIFTTAEVMEVVPFMKEAQNNFTVMIPVQGIHSDVLQSIIESVVGLYRHVQFKFETKKRIYVTTYYDLIQNSRIEYKEDVELWRA